MKKLSAPSHLVGESSFQTAVELILNDVFKAHPNFGHGLRMSGEAYYRHLDYLELTEARKNSKQAMWMAIAAIVVSIIVGVLQILASR